MWPFNDDTVVENQISVHEVAAYSFDGAIIVAILLAALYYHWNRSQMRLCQLEEGAVRSRIEGVSRV